MGSQGLPDQPGLLAQLVPVDQQVQLALPGQQVLARLLMCRSLQETALGLSPAVPRW